MKFNRNQRQSVKTYQETNGVRVEFDDFKEVKEALESLKK